MSHHLVDLGGYEKKALPRIIKGDAKNFKDCPTRPSLKKAHAPAEKNPPPPSTAFAFRLQ